MLLDSTAQIVRLIKATKTARMLQSSHLANLKSRFVGRLFLVARLGGG
jgi:hypothetical protein